MSSTDLVLSVFELVLMVFSLCLHDCIQAWTANRLGDPTARMMGRLTMNPVQHYDPLGTILFPIIYLFRSPPFLMGWTKPIPMTSRNFRKPRRDENLVYSSGPVAQLTLALLALVAITVLRHVGGAGPALQAAANLARHLPNMAMDELPPLTPLMLLLYYTVFINTLLFSFNLVPFPFFDGGKILANQLPYNLSQKYQNASIYFMFAFFFVGFPLVMMSFAPVMGIFDAIMGV